MEFPFNEHIKDGYYIRTFSTNIDEMELVWHRASEDRIIEVIDNTDWMIQIDGELPKIMNEKIFIPKEKYHRVIKGRGDLVLKIKKL